MNTVCAIQRSYVFLLYPPLELADFRRKPQEPGDLSHNFWTTSEEQVDLVDLREIPKIVLTLLTCIYKIKCMCIYIEREREVYVYIYIHIYISIHTDCVFLYTVYIYQAIFRETPSPPNEPAFVQPAFRTRSGAREPSSRTPSAQPSGHQNWLGNHPIEKWANWRFPKS